MHYRAGAGMQSQKASARFANQTDRQVRPSMSHAIWAEFMPYSWVQADLKRLAAHHLQINLAISLARPFDNTLKQFLRAAAAEGVPVGAWLLLDDQQGYWPNASNASLYCKEVARFVSWLETERLSIREVIVDMETPLMMSRLLKTHLLRGLKLEYQRWLSLSNHLQFWEGVDHFRQLVRALRQAGLRAQVVTYPMIVHDLVAGQTAFQEFLQVPVTPVDWDQISLMVYRSSFQDLLPFAISADLVYRYFKLAKTVLPNTPVCAALGVIGSIGKVSEGGFQDPQALYQDLAAARAAGVTHAQLFSLDGMHQLGNPQDWLAVFEAKAARPQSLPGDRLLWQGLLQSHRLLSQQYRRFWAQSKNAGLPSRLHALNPNL